MLCLGRRVKRCQQTGSKEDKMLVSEGNNILTQQSIKVVVVAAWDGSEWTVNINPDFTVDQLKLMALGHFYNPSETFKLSSFYKLVSVASDKQLNEEFTLQQEDVKNEDELLLIKKKPSRQDAHVTQEVKDILSKGPDEASIQQITLHVPVKNASRVAEDAVTVVDFQVELRKTLVSLIEAAQKIQLYNKKNLSYFIFLPKDANVTVDLVDPVALKQLTDMGFSVAKSCRALLEKHMSSVDALEYLLGQDQLETEDDTDVPEHSASVTLDSSNHLTCATCSASTVESSEESLNTSTKATESVSSSKLIPLHQLLEAFRAYKRRDFRPNRKAFQSLQEMGFDQEKIVDALRVSGNNHDAAFEWLLSHWLTDNDLKSGLDPEGSIYKAIMANPVIQLGLNSPKVLYAFLHMLENPNCANHWLNDPDLSPVLNHIFKIYHLEKYSLQIRHSRMSNS